jgi:hypothetical protein
MFRRTATEALIQEILQGDYLTLEVDRYELSENVGAGTGCEASFTLCNRNDPNATRTLSGRGVGFVDAIYHGLIDYYAPEFPSLGTISFTGFEVTGQMETSDASGADAEAVVALKVENSEGRTFEFQEAGRSMIAAGIGVVVEALEYFINSERAYVTAYRALSDARERGRPDLIQRYTSYMAELVNTTSYSEVIARIQAESKL